LAVVDIPSVAVVAELPAVEVVPIFSAVVDPGCNFYGTIRPVVGCNGYT